MGIPRLWFLIQPEYLLFIQRHVTSGITQHFDIDIQTVITINKKLYLILKKQPIEFKYFGQVLFTILQLNPLGRKLIQDGGQLTCLT